MVGRLRLDRFLANMGCGSRNEVKRMLHSGKVAVNGVIVTDETRHITPQVDRVRCAGELIPYREFIYLMLNKPAGVISATEDIQERTVLDLVAEQYRNRGLFPVGRLDKDSEGLLILTNNGSLGHRLLAPQKHIVKRYFAQIAGKVGDEDIAAFQGGVVLGDGYRTMPAQLELIGFSGLTDVQSEAEVQSDVVIEIHEGKFHQIKRMMQALGKQVIYLKRIAMGALTLDPALSPGEYRELSEQEIKLLAESAADTNLHINRS